jgi:hypothetical protein
MPHFARGHLCMAAWRWHEHFISWCGRSPVALRSGERVDLAAQRAPQPASAVSFTQGRRQSDRSVWHSVDPARHAADRRLAADHLDARHHPHRPVCAPSLTARRARSTTHSAHCAASSTVSCSRAARSCSATFSDSESILALTSVRGRIDVLETFAGDLLSKGMVACRFEEFTFDTPRNRLVRVALDSLAARVDDRLLA